MVQKGGYNISHSRKKKINSSIGTLGVRITKKPINNSKTDRILPTVHGWINPLNPLKKKNYNFVL